MSGKDAFEPRLVTNKNDGLMSKCIIQWNCNKVDAIAGIFGRDLEIKEKQAQPIRFGL